jgi:DNA-directed RNA polymerase specialized sigma subunit
MTKNIEDYIYNRRKLAWYENHRQNDTELISYLKNLQDKTIKAIETLPKQVSKTVLFMYYIEGIGIKGISNYLHFSQVYVSKIKSRALKALSKITI